MVKKLLALFLMAMLVVPTSAFAAGKYDQSPGRSGDKALKGNESHNKQAVPVVEDLGDADDEATQIAEENDESDAKEISINNSNNNKSDKDRADGTRGERAATGQRALKSLKVEPVEDESTGSANNADSARLEKAELKAEKKAEKAAVKDLKKRLREERKLLILGSRDDSDKASGIDSDTAEDIGTARGIKGLTRAVEAIKANIDRMVSKFGDGTKKAQKTLERVLEKINYWISKLLPSDSMINDGEENTDSGPGSDENTTTPDLGSGDSTSTP